MRATKPHVHKELVALGDRIDIQKYPHIMARSGDCVGMSNGLAVWRFGFSPGSEAAAAYEVCINDWSSPEPNSGGFVWVLATRKTGIVKEIWRGFAVNLPAQFRRTINWRPPTNKQHPN